MGSVTEWKSTQIELTILWFSDEAHFHFMGAINNHNILWGAESHEEVAELSLKVSKSTYFCALNDRWDMLGPYWFDDANGKAVTVNGMWYLEV